MKIAVFRETFYGESRVALTPEIVKKAVTHSEVLVETEAGLQAGFSDAMYKEAGAKIIKKSEGLFEADLLLSVNQLTGNLKELKTLFDCGRQGQVYMANLSALSHRDSLNIYQKKKMTVLSLDLIPRISRAQSMDILSSQANLAGYRAVIEAVYEYGRSMPMMMTAAGTVAPAKVLILGAGVAGLQAIATARRLGAIVFAFDVRSAAKEQVESLGAKFICVDTDADGEDKGGYAREMSSDYQKRQMTLIGEALKQTDIVITTALIPGKKAPVLITENMLHNMRPGSIIVDMAALQGGNCEGSKVDEVVNREGVKIIGYSNMASRLPQDSSQLFAKNVWNFLNLCWNEDAQTYNFQKDDEIIKAVKIMEGGVFVHPTLQSNEG